MSETDAPVQRYGDFADTVSTYLDEVKTLAGKKREDQLAQAKLIETGAYKLADDPKQTSGPPTALKAVPFFNFAPLENAVVRLKASAAAYDKTLAAKAPTLSGDAKARLVALAGKTEQAMTSEPGLPGGRGWYKNMVYAPGRFTGYGAKTLPGVREAIEDERWDDANAYVGYTAKALNAYADLLDQGVALMGGPAAP